MSPVPVVVDLAAAVANTHTSSTDNLTGADPTAATATVMVMCKPYRAGPVTIQVSEHADFSSVHTTVERVAGARNAVNGLNGSASTTAISADSSSQGEEDGAALDDILPVKVSVSGLRVGTLYYVRCTRYNNNPVVLPVAEEDEEEVAETFYETSRFWTLPSEDMLPESGSVQEAEGGAPSSQQASSADFFPSLPLRLVCFGQALFGSTAGSVVSAPGEEQQRIVLLNDSDQEGAPLYTCLQQHQHLHCRRGVCLLLAHASVHLGADFAAAKLRRAARRA